MELPQDISAYYHGLLFNRKNQRLFNEEMLYTTEMFFKKDLNLSDTARQLYIHRNTLVYRLKQIKECMEIDINDNGTARELLSFMMMYDIARRHK